MAGGDHADKALNKMRSAYGYWRPLLACARLPTRVRLLMLQTFVYSAVTYGAEVWDCTQLMRERMSVVVKKGVRAILGLHPWTAHVMRCTGTPDHSGALIDAAKICWHDKCQHAAEGLDQVLWTSVTGRRGAGRPRWELIGRRVCRRLSRVQIALNIADVSAGRRTAAGATYGSTPLPASLQPASLRWTRRLVIWRARKWQGVLCVQPYWITCGWLISRRCRQPTRNALRADQGGFQSVC
jgi:hypothetical protein